ncbi:BTAD domain-containing putative transcriptional regulator [Caulobacter sp. BP25]|uniref:BTAD domain-containing putative transcriptional regulator n=1 Tax=Caulobacter sp. BP25 TaxID=2048900 RepID=UPI00137483BE|nr:BTAD domain-containing putative transcriptional regulator [Caulobacter sp. BP25]
MSSHPSRAADPLAESAPAKLARTVARIHIVGTMRAMTYDGTSLLPRGRKARAILALLCMSRGASVPRSRLAALLWDRSPEAQARTSLRQALSELATSWSCVPNLLQIGRDQVRLCDENCWIDAVHLPSVGANIGGEAGDEAEDDYLNAMSGTLLEDLDGVSPTFDQWLREERARFENRLRKVCEARLLEASSQDASPQRRARIARTLIEHDPTHEGAWQALLSALLNLGDRAQVIREYQRCRRALKDGLDVQPSEATDRLYRAARAQQEQNVSPAIAEAPTAPAALPGGRLRVGILPFVATAPLLDSTLCWSLSLDMAAALARFRWFDVITPMGIATLGVDQTGQARALDTLAVDYAIQGTLTPIGDGIRVRVVLLRLHGPPQTVWSDNYDLPIDALAEADERVTTKLVARIDPVILQIEGARPSQRDVSSATRLVLKAIPLLYSMERQRYDEAGAMLRQAAAAAPDDSMVAAWSAFWYLFHVGQGWSICPNQEYIEAERLSRHAIDLDPENAEALGIYAHLCSFVHHDFKSASHYFNQSLILNPSLAFIWALSAPTSCYMGHPDDALRRLRRYRELAPFDPYHRLFESIETMAHLFARDYASAVAIGRRSVRANPTFTNGYKPLISALGHLGLRDEASGFIATLMQLEPDFSIATFARRYPFQAPEDRDHYIAGLREAGVCEF